MNGSAWGEKKGTTSVAKGRAAVIDVFLESVLHALIFICGS